MNLFIKSSVITLDDFKGEFFETIIAQYGEVAKLVIRTFINEKGESDTKFMVYSNDVSLISTYDIKEAIGRYNSLEAHLSKMEESQS